MQIEISLHATLRRHLQGDTSNPLRQLTVGERTTVRQLLAELQVPQNEVHLIFVNGVAVDADAVLTDGARVGVFPPLGGG